MQQRDLRRGAGLGQYLRTRRIGAERDLGLQLGVVDLGIGRGIDYERRRDLCQRPRDRIGISDIDGMATYAVNMEIPTVSAGHQFLAKLAPRPEHKDRGGAMGRHAACPRLVSPRDRRWNV